MKKEKAKKRVFLLVLLIALSIALVASGVTLAVNIFSDEIEESVDFGVISLDTSLITAFNSGDLDNVIHGQKIADAITISNNTTATNIPFYLRVQFMYTTDNNELLPRNQLQYITLLNNSFTPFEGETLTLEDANGNPVNAGYRWSQRQGDYFYLLVKSSNPGEDGKLLKTDLIKEFKFADVLNFLVETESYPSVYSKPNGLKLIINVQAIQAEYLTAGGTDVTDYVESEKYFDEVFPEKYTTPVTFDIYFDGDGATGETPYIAPVEYGQPITLPMDNPTDNSIEKITFVKPNYYVEKWNDGKGNGDASEFDQGQKYIVTGNVTFKAMWRIKETDDKYFCFHEIKDGSGEVIGYEVSKQGDEALPSFTVIPTTYNPDLNDPTKEKPVLRIAGEADKCSECTGFVDSREIVTLYIPISIEAESAKEKNSTEGLDEQILTIGDGAFRGCTSMAEVVFESDLQTIGNNAFNGCGGLRGIDLPESVTVVGDAAFMGCTVLRTADLSPALTEISVSCFENCHALREIVFPRNLTIIKNRAFYACAALKEITFPLNLKSIGDYAFASSASLPMQLEKIDYEYGMEFGPRVIPSPLPTGVAAENIGNGFGRFCFENCQRLQSVTVPDEITYLSEGVFKYCSSLKTVQTGEQIMGIGDQCFAYCTSLTSFEFPVVTEGSNFYLGKGVFEFCETITAMIFPDSIKTLSDRLFYHCSQLKRITADGTTYVGNETFAECPLFAGISSQRTLVLTGVTYVGHHAFYNDTSVLYVSFGKDLQVIEEYAFAGCSSLARINSPSGNIVDLSKGKAPNLLKLGAYAFRDCTSIIAVDLNKDLGTVRRDTSNNIIEGYGTADKYAGNYSYEKGKYEFSGYMYDHDGDEDTPMVSNYASPEKVALRAKYALGEGIFYNCSNLTFFNASKTLSALTNVYEYTESFVWNMKTNFIREYMFYNCNFFSLRFAPSDTLIFGLNCLENCRAVSIVDFDSVNTYTNREDYMFDDGCLNGLGSAPQMKLGVLSHADFINTLSDSWNDVSSNNFKIYKSFHVRYQAGKLVIKVNSAFDRKFFNALKGVSGGYTSMYAYFDWNNPDAWDATKTFDDKHEDYSDEFGGGLGTMYNPYQISTPGQLIYLRNQINNGTISRDPKGEQKYFVVTCSIDLGGMDWQGIGGSGTAKFYNTASLGFCFHFSLGTVPGYKVVYNIDGSKRYEPIYISNYKVVNSVNSRYVDAYAGFFNLIAIDGVVQGLSVYNAKVYSNNSYGANASVTKGGSYAGAIAGINNGLIQDCHVGVKKTSYTTASVKYYVSGELKTINLNKKISEKVNITNNMRYVSYNADLFTFSYSGDGGVSYIGTPKFNENVDDTTASTFDSHNGGIVGQQHNSVARTMHCFVGKSVYVRGPAKRWSSVGGICGSNNNALIRNCISTANIAAYAQNSTSYSGQFNFGFAGGISGVNAGILFTCYSAGKVVSSGGHKGYAGGVAGYIHNQYGRTGTNTSNAFYMKGSSFMRAYYGSVNRVGVGNCDAYMPSSSYVSGSSTSYDGYVGGRIEDHSHDQVVIGGYTPTAVFTSDSWGGIYPDKYSDIKDKVEYYYNLGTYKPSQKHNGDYYGESTGSVYGSSKTATEGVKSTYNCFIMNFGDGVGFFEPTNSALHLIELIAIVVSATDVVLISILAGNRRKKKNVRS